MEIPVDLSMGNLVETCLEYSGPLVVRANSILDIIFSQPGSPHYQSLLMSLFDRVEKMNRPLESYGKFFEAACRNKSSSSIAVHLVKTKWNHQHIPLSGKGSTELNLLT